MSESRWEELHASAPLTDIHVHPSLKAYLFRRNLWRHYRSGATFNPFSSRSDFTMLAKGKVGVIWSALYLPELQLFCDCWLLQATASVLIPKVYPRIHKGQRFHRLLEMMNAMEEEIRRKPDRVELALSAADVKRITVEGKLAVVHTIEGAHVLDGDARKLEYLSARGVASLTLCHFYYNGVAGQVDAIPTDLFIRKVCSFSFGTAPVALSDYGKDVLRMMKTLRMIVDVSHCSRAARTAVFDEVGADRPVIASHVGLRVFNNAEYNLDDDEVRFIASTDGMVGLIFMTYWLDREHPKEGLAALWRTLEHIRKVTGSWDYVGVGTDFDGFTDPPDDVEDSSRLPAFTEMLTRQKLTSDLTSDDIRKILGGNAQRVLEKGWR